MGEAHQVHDQMVRMVLTTQQRQSAHPWTQERADRPVPHQQHLSLVHPNSLNLK